MSQTKTRSLVVKPTTGHLVLRNNQDIVSDQWSQKVPDYPNGSQVTVSENHPGWRDRKGLATGDIGGDFTMSKSWISCNTGHQTLRHRRDLFGNGQIIQTSVYTGPVLSYKVKPGDFPSVAISGDSSLDAWGAKAISEAKPTNALVDLSTALGELLGPGGIPRMTVRAGAWKHGLKTMKDAKAASKGVADDYLNFQFGLIPTTSDVVSFAVAADSFNRLVRQYERDAGKVVRRRWSFEPITSEEVTVTTGMPYMDPMSGVFFPANGTIVRTRNKSVRRWFSGAFTYHLPAGYSSRNKLISFESQIQQLLGIQPTPETLWNLAPWSWAVDWFSSAGDVVSNISDWATDGLVMRYGYIMEHSMSVDTYTHSSNGVSPVTVGREVKRRRRANPFGFGLTWNGLSPRQLAIAAALGITRIK
uniref:Uncharacterized protein n=1 Tax=Leviviridae sp. TaxID=2027243 RepID=A0A514D6Y4_9VIRU|nr:MAG: hypothetical protein H2RhizoLitter8242_000006 [Leviviridae sp.]